ncbi:hypothetical protein RB195_022987 [Necator americanus]|uniref:IFT121-like TPR repeats domain-containing protein n=1 Tax=Necator americanus TaxID=51031 RepID=A0ABR1EHF3_NECAM
MVTFIPSSDSKLVPKLVEAYSLSSCACRQFPICSRAFMKLESIVDPLSDERRRYQTLALQLFRRFLPTEGQPNIVNCTGCGENVADFEHICAHCNAKIFSGRFRFKRTCVVDIDLALVARLTGMIKHCVTLSEISPMPPQVKCQLHLGAAVQYSSDVFKL